MIKLRGEETAVAAPPVQEQHGRVTFTRRVECKPRRPGLRHPSGALLIDRGHCFLPGSHVP
jgi:hypothetical protein